MKIRLDSKEKVEGKVVYECKNPNGRFRGFILPKGKRVVPVDGIGLEVKSNGEATFLFLKDWEAQAVISCLSIALLEKKLKHLEEKYG